MPFACAVSYSVFSSSYRSRLVVLKTTTLLQLWLQPHLQGYPPFEDFPRLYEEAIGLLVHLSGVERLSHFELLQASARAVDEFFNVRNGTADPWITEAKKFTGRGKKKIAAIFAGRVANVASLGDFLVCIFTLFHF